MQVTNRHFVFVLTISVAAITGILLAQCQELQEIEGGEEDTTSEFPDTLCI